MCTFVIATLPESVDLAALESAIPRDLKLKLLRGGLQDETVSVHGFGFTPFSNHELEKQLPCNDQLALMTRLHCDCWTTLATTNTSRRETQRWRNIFREMLTVIDRFGLILHFGDPSDSFTLNGPEVRCVCSSDCLFGLRRDTLYEILLT